MGNTIPITTPNEDLDEKKLQTSQAILGGITKSNLMGLDTDYAVTNKFILYVPIQNVLGNAYNGLELHLTRFSLPQVEIGSTSVSYKGDSVDYPTRLISPSSKELTIEYVVDANWSNYRALYCWAANIGVASKITQQQTTTTMVTSNLLPVRVYLLDQYKQKVIEFIYSNCWIKRFADLALDYTQSPNEIHHSFTMAYSNFEIADVTN